ncbi:acyl-CoA N-acyltransferase [Glonium stellatum]|uniref:Acyl-CoA N-acyltransferase n=1 Tax=Glonium stellatum TaxID=574774 RepID=A0A8E2EYY8_9PEZI|nr:acyl-CoA N-acyltransferase [Glonium stellatum]
MVGDKEVKIRSGRLLMRPLRLDDAPDVFLMRSSAAVMKFTRSTPETDVKQSEEWITKCLERPNCWNFSMELLPRSVDDTAPPETPHKARVIGVIGAIRAPEVGYMIHTDFWGKGYTSEALQAFMPVFFEHYSDEERYDFAEAHVDPEHGPSRRVLEKAGFTLLEVRKQDFDSPTLGMRDTCIYRLNRPRKALEED